MPKLMHKRLCKIVVLFLFCSFQGKAQTTSEFEQIGYLLSDALFYSNQYITPATDAAVYQASSSWMNSVKLKKKWQVDVGLHANMFFVPKSDRSFKIQNSDFDFFQIENATSATVPTALGDDNQYFLVGDLNGQQVRLKTPEGVNQESIIYPYLQVSLGLPYGFEAVGRYSTRTKLKKGEYQVYGFGLKHNFSQYLPKLEAKNIYVSAMVMYSNEEISFDFLDINTSYGNLGINQLTGFVDTYHFQTGISKQYKSFEFMMNAIVNTSNFKYEVSGSGAETTLFKDLVNQQLTSLEDTKTNFIGEVGVNYFFNDFFIKSSFSFGKFANVNLGLNYTIN